MIVSLKEQLANWKYGRGIVLKFINELSDYDLDKKLPRNQLNTIRLQIEELAMIQKNYVDALTTRKIAFEGNQLDDKSKQGLVQELTKLDKKLEETLETFDGTEKTTELENQNGMAIIIAGEKKGRFCFKINLPVEFEKR